MNKTMHGQKNFWQKSLRSTAWMLWLVMFLNTLSGQENGLNSRTNLADEQLIRIVKKHEALLGQYAEDPSKFGKRELSTRVQSVIAAYTAFNNDNTDDVFGYVLHGKFLREIGRFEEAYNMFQKANKLDPNIAIVKQQLGNFLAESGRYKEAYPLFVSAVKLDPEKAIYQYQLGAHLIYFGKQLQAEKQMSPMDFDRQLSSSLSEAVRLAPENRTYKHLFAESFYDLNKPNWEMALKIWTELLGPDSSKTQTEAIQLQRARVLAHLDKKSEAKKLLQQVTHPSLSATKRKLQAQLDLKPSASAQETKPQQATMIPINAANKSLQQEVDKLRKELSDLKNKKSLPPQTRPAPPSVPVKAHNKALAELNDNLKQLDRDNKEIIKELEISRQKVIAQNKSIQKKEMATNELKNELETTHNKLESALKQLSLPKPKSIPLADHNKKLQTIEQSLSNSRKEKDLLEKETKAIKAELEESRRIKNGLKQARAELNVAKADLQKHMQSADKTRAQLEKEKHSLLNQVNILKKSSKEEANKMAAELQKELSAERVQTEILETEKAKQTKEIQFLNNELSNLESKLLNLLDTKSKAERQQYATIKQHLTTIESLKQEIVSKEKIRTELISSMHEKSRSDMELRQKLQKISREHQSYQAFTDLLEGVIESLSTGTIDMVESLVSEVGTGRKELKEQLDRSEKNNDILQTEVEKLQSLIKLTQKNSEKQMAEAKSDRSNLEKEIISLRTKSIKISDELGKALNMTKSLEANTDQVKKDNLNLKDELKREVAQAQLFKTEADKIAETMAKEKATAVKREKQLEELSSKLRNNQNMVTDREKVISTLQAEIEATKVATQKLSEEINKGKDAMEKLFAHAQNQSQENSQLKSERDQIKKQNVNLKKQSKLSEETVSILDSKIKEMEEDALENQKSYSDLKNQVVEQKVVSMELVDWAITLSDEVKGEEALTLITNQHFEDEIQTKIKIAKEKADETKLLRDELNKVRTNLSESEQKARDTREGMSIQIKSGKEREAMLQQNLEATITLNSATEKKWRSSLDEQNLLKERIRIQEAKIASYAEEQKNIAEMDGTIEAQNSAIQEADALNRKISEQLNVAKKRINDQTDTIAIYQDTLKKSVDQIDNSHNWVEILVTVLEDNINQARLQEESQILQIKELQDQVIAETNQKNQKELLELQKSRADVQIAQEKAEVQRKQNQDLRNSNNNMIEQIQLLKAADKKNQKVTEVLAKEISGFKIQEKKLLTEITEKEKELIAQSQSSEKMEKEFMAQLAQARELQGEKIKQIKNLKSTLAKSQIEPNERKDLTENYNEELIVTLEDWVDTLTHEILVNPQNPPSGESNLQKVIEANALKFKSLEKELEASITATKKAESELLSVNKERQKIQEELDLKKISTAKSNKENQNLAHKLSAMEKKLKAGHIASIKPLQAELFVTKEKNYSLTKKLLEEEKETKFLSAELHSLESNLLKVLKKKTEDEKAVAKETKNLLRQLEQSKETIATLKSNKLPTPPDASDAKLNKMSALNTVYEKQIAELKASYKSLQEEASATRKGLQKQLEGIQFELVTVNKDKQVLTTMHQSKSGEVTVLNSKLKALKEKLTSNNIPQDQQVKELENKLKLSIDSSNSLRSRIQGLDKEKIEIAEKLILTEGNLARARKQLSSMQDNIDKLVKYVPGQPIKKQLETVKSELASYRKDTASRMMKLTEVESDLMKTKQALSDKEKDTKSLTQNYKDKLSEIVKSSKQLQNALAQTRNELSKARDEKNQTIIELAQEYTNMKNHVQLLQGELDETRKQGATKSTASKESKLLADALEKLTKSDNIIYSLRQNLTESRSQNTRITASHTLLSEKIKELEQVDIPSASEQTNTEPRQKIAQLEEALQLSRTKLADRDRQFENVVARMNLILERLHSSAAVQAP